MFLNKRSGPKIYISRHYTIADFSEDNLFEGTDRTDFPAHVELPYPIHRPFSTTEHDAVTQLLVEKGNYNKLCESKLRRYKYDKKNIVTEKLKGHKYMYLPIHLLEFYAKKDPDPYFDCDYNYYYTGGNLEYLQINSDDYLIRCDGENHLCLSDVHNPQVSKQLNYSTTAPIFSINSITSNNDNLLVLRQKHHVDVVKLVNKETIDTVWKNEYHIPVMDAKLNSKKATHLGTIESNLKLSVRDVEVNKTVFSFKNNSETKSDNFQQFQFFDAHLIGLADRFSVKLIDYRAKTEEGVLDPQVVQCNSLCNFKIVGNNLLLASRHYLMKSDLRYLKNVSYYTHFLESAPCYIDFTVKESDTFMCLANQIQGNKILFTGRSNYTLPYKVPGIQDTLKKCRLENAELVLVNNLDKRLSLSTAGLKVLNLDGDVFIYSSNCLGEVFCQKVADDPPSTEKPTQALLEWINNLEKPQPVLYVTNVEEMSRARFSLNTKPIEHNLRKYKTSKADDFLQTFGPRYSVRNVSSTLAKDFLSVWSDDDEEEIENIPEVPSGDKVSDWIQTHDFSEDDDIC